MRIFFLYTWLDRISIDFPFRVIFTLAVVNGVKFREVRTGIEFLIKFHSVAIVTGLDYIRVREV